MRVLVVDDESLALDRLETFFGDIEGVEIVGRAGDRFEVAIACRWEGEDRASRMFTQSFGAGHTARLYLRYEDGGLAYLEAL